MTFCFDNFDFAMMVDLRFAYEEYVDECEKNNKTPLSFSEWWENLE